MRHGESGDSIHCMESGQGSDKDPEDLIMMVMSCEMRQEGWPG